MKNGIITRICEDNGIKLTTATDDTFDIIGCSGKKRKNVKDGLAFKYKGVPYIAINPDAGFYEQFFTAAHELGHLLLGHLDGSVNNPTVQENEANSFAGAMLALRIFEDYGHED